MPSTRTLERSCFWNNIWRWSKSMSYIKCKFILRTLRIVTKQKRSTNFGTILSLINKTHKWNAKWANYQKKWKSSSMMLILMWSKNLKKVKMKQIFFISRLLKSLKDLRAVKTNTHIRWNQRCFRSWWHLFRNQITLEIMRWGSN